MTDRSSSSYLSTSFLGIFLTFFLGAALVLGKVPGIEWLFFQWFQVTLLVVIIAGLIAGSRRVKVQLKYKVVGNGVCLIVCALLIFYIRYRVCTYAGDANDIFDKLIVWMLDTTFKIRQLKFTSERLSGILIDSGQFEVIGLLTVLEFIAAFFSSYNLGRIFLGRGSPINTRERSKASGFFD